MRIFALVALGLNGCAAARSPVDTGASAPAMYVDWVRVLAPND